MVMELSSSSRFPLDTTLLLINIADHSLDCSVKLVDKSQILNPGWSERSATKAESNNLGLRHPRPCHLHSWLLLGRRA